MKVAYFGREGSFAHEAARKAFPHIKAFLPGGSVEDVLDILYASGAECGLVPVENTSGGMVTDSLDALLSRQFIRSRYRIQEEITLPVRLSLLSRAPLSRVRTIYSHPIPFHFLAGWIKRHLPRSRKITTGSTAEGALLAARDPHGAAIGNRIAAEIYGLKVLPVRLPQQPNQTSFYAIAHQPLSRIRPKRTAICLGLPNTPGSLVKILSIFAAQRINLTRLTSRPLSKRKTGFRPNQYVFWMDLEGTPSKPHVRLALQTAKRTASFLDILGIYPTRHLR